MPNQPSAFPRQRILGLLAGAILLIALAAWLLRTREPGPSLPEPAAESAASAPAAAGPAAPAQPEAAAPEAQPRKPQFDSAAYDQRIAALVAAVQTRRAAGADEARRQIPGLLVSNDPRDVIAGLALLAGLDAWDLRPDFSRYAPEIPLAAADLCAALFDPAPANALLVQWKVRAGGSQAAGEKAHDLLLKANLPFGGGSAALDLMQSVNDPQAIFIGLYEFAVDPRLSGAIRTEALVRLRGRMEPDAYLDLVRECAERARQDDEDWALRAERLQARLDAAVDRRFVDVELARPYPGLVEDLELYLRDGFESGRLDVDPETAAFFRDSLDKLDAAALAGPDRAAAQRLRRTLEAKIR